jgi:hypothetical protein
MPTRMLPVKLTEDELLQRGKIAAEAIEKKASLKDGLKNAAAVFRGKIKLQDEIINKLSHQISTGEEDREVEVKIKKDHENKRYMEVREDTGEVTVDRAMTPGELQTEIPFTPPTERKKWKGSEG